MWSRKSSDPTPPSSQTSKADSGRPYNRYTFVQSTFDWNKVDHLAPYSYDPRIANFIYEDFCAVNRETAWRTRGPASAVLLRGCAATWERDPIPLESMCRVRTGWAVGSPSDQQSECFARIEDMTRSAEAKAHEPPQVWHMPLDEQTVDNARRHCGMPVGDLSEAVREMKDDLEIAIMCERNAKSDAPRGIKAAVTQFCHETKPDAEATIRRMAQEARAGDFTVTCLQNQLGLTPPRP